MPNNEKSDEVTVRLLVYSGREDPEWRLHPDQARECVERLGEAAGDEAATLPEPAGLGYRGFLLSGLRGAGAATDTVRVHRGILSEEERGRERHRHDRAGLEAWLLAQAREHGHGTVLDALDMGGEIA